MVPTSFCEARRSNTGRTCRSRASAPQSGGRVSARDEIENRGCLPPAEWLHSGDRQTEGISKMSADGLGGRVAVPRRAIRRRCRWRMRARQQGNRASRAANLLGRASSRASSRASRGRRLPARLLLAGRRCGKEEEASPCGTGATRACVRSFLFGRILYRHHPQNTVRGPAPPLARPLRATPTPPARRARRRRTTTTPARPALATPRSAAGAVVVARAPVSCAAAGSSRLAAASAQRPHAEAVAVVAVAAAAVVASISIRPHVPALSRSSHGGGGGGLKQVPHL